MQTASHHYVVSHLAVCNHFHHPLSSHFVLGHKLKYICAVRVCIYVCADISEKYVNSENKCTKNYSNKKNGNNKKITKTLLSSSRQPSVMKTTEAAFLAAFSRSHRKWSVWSCSCRWFCFLLPVICELRG